MNIKKIIKVLLAVFISINSYAQVDLVITEIMYNPPEAGNDSLEYLEIYNNESSEVDLLGFTLSGVVYTFPSTILQSGEYLVVAKDSVAMRLVFNIHTQQWGSGAVHNQGETILLKDASGQTVDSVAYDDAGPWPTDGADGLGKSLVLCDYTSDNSIGSNWEVSGTLAGEAVNTYEIYGSPELGDVICLTALNNKSAEVNVEVYPNPVQGELTINIKTLKETTLSILDASGVLVQSSKLTLGENVISVDDLESGFYIVKVQEGESFHSHKIFKD